MLRTGRFHLSIKMFFTNNDKLHNTVFKFLTACYKKTKKCQPSAGNTPDLIQTECVADRGLARPNTKKSTERKKYKYKKLNGKLFDLHQRSGSVNVELNIIKTKKCHPAAGGMPDLIQTAHAPSSRVSRPNKKNIKDKMRKKSDKMKKIKIEYKGHRSFCLFLWLFLWYTVNEVQMRADWKVVPQFTDRNYYSDFTGSSLDGNYKHLNEHLFFLSNKDRNRAQKSVNGNRTDSVKILQWNMGSKLWKNKLLEIQSLLAEYKPDLCYITEANLWEGCTPDEMEIPGHWLVLPNTISTLHHARIVLIVRNGLIVEKLDKLMDDNLATIWVRVGQAKKKSIISGGIYREFHQPGSGDNDLPAHELQLVQEQRWRSIMNKWKSINSRCVVVGDLNLDHLKWGHPDTNVTKMVEEVQSTVENEGYCQLVVDATRFQENSTPSLLDHIWTNCDERTLGHFNSSRSSSDHNVVGLTISVCDIKLGGHTVRKRCWKNFVLDRCVDKFKSIDWTDLYQQTNINLANTILEDNILNVIDSEAPMKTLQVRTKYCKWLSDVTKVTMVQRDLARDIAVVTGDSADWLAYRDLRNEATSQQRKDKADFTAATFRHIEETNDAAKLHSVTRELLGWTKSGPPALFKVAGKSYRKKKDIDEIQAKYYESKVMKIKETLPRVNYDPLTLLRKAFERWLPPVGLEKCTVSETTDKEVWDMITNLKNSHLYGHNGIDAATLKIGGKTLVEPIRFVINLSLGTGEVPMKWKLARIIPLLKSTDMDKTSPKSFRPISQLDIVSKLAERKVQSCLLSYLERTSQLNTDHHAYRHYLSTTTALITMMDQVATAVDDNLICSSMSVDLSSAFDCVDHSILLDKLSFNNLDDNLILWIKSYLQHRSCYVTVGTATSSFRTLRYGVPQGSVLRTPAVPYLRERVLGCHGRRHLQIRSASVKHQTVWCHV